MRHAVKYLVLILLSLDGVIAQADEAPRRPSPPASVQNDSLLKRAYATRDQEIIDFIKDQELSEGREGLRDRTFRAELREKLKQFESDRPVRTEARSCPSCDRNSAQLTNSEVRKLRALLNRIPSQPEDFGQGQAPNAMAQSLMQAFAQMLAGMNGNVQMPGQNLSMGQNQMFGQNQFFRQNQAYAPNYIYANPIQGNQFVNYRQSPAMAYSVAPAIAGPVTGQIANNYANLTANHYSLINRGNSAPAVLPYRL